MHFAIIIVFCQYFISARLGNCLLFGRLDQTTVSKSYQIFSNLAQKHSKNQDIHDPKYRAKLIRFLQYRGYEWEDISQALATLKIVDASVVLRHLLKRPVYLIVGYALIPQLHFKPCLSFYSGVERNVRTRIFFVVDITVMLALLHPKRWLR